MKNPLKHHSAPVAARPNDTSKTEEHGHSRNHSHNSSIGHIFSGLTHRFRSDTPNRDQQQATAANSFHIVHLPDRPLVPIQPSDAPSEDECRLLFQGLHLDSGLSSPEAIFHQQAQVDRTQTAMQSRSARSSQPKRATVSSSSSPSSSRPQTSHSAKPPSSPRKAISSSQARFLAPTSSSRARTSTLTQAPVATTNTPRERQTRATQPSAASSQSAWSVPRVASRPSVHSNASTTTTNTSTSGSSGNSGGSNSVRIWSSNGSRSSQPRGNLRPPPVSVNVDASRPSYISRPLPQIPQSPVQLTPPSAPSPQSSCQQPPRKAPLRQQTPLPTRAPAPLSARPLLLPRAAVPPPQLASFSERVARSQAGDSPYLPSLSDQSQSVPEQRQQVRKQSPSPRPPPPPPLHRSPPPPSSQRPVSPPQQRPQHQRKNSQPQQPKLWVPRVSSPLRQAQLSSPSQTQAPQHQQQQQPSSPRPNSADVSPLTPPPQSPIRDNELVPERRLPFGDSDDILRPTIYGTQDPETANALRAAEKQNGEPLLEWEVEIIKASREKKRRIPQVQMAHGHPHLDNFVRWEKQARANRAAFESSSTALAFLLKSMTGMPSKEQQKMGIVSIGSVSQTCPLPCSVTPTTLAADYEAQAHRAVIFKDDRSSSGSSSGGDYTSSWPESSYYFGNNGSISGTIDEKRQHSQPTSTYQSSRRSSQESNTIKRQPCVSKTAEARHVHYASQR